MRFSTTTLLLILNIDQTSCFSTCFLPQRHTALFSESAIAEPEAAEVPVATTDEESSPVIYPTKFDTFKKKWKGPRLASLSAELDDVNPDFSYEDFDEAVAKTTYAFSRNDIVKGTVVQYDNGGCTVDIGAKASAFMPIAEAALIQKTTQTTAPDGTTSITHNNSIESLIDLGTEREFQIISDEDENGQLLVSVRRIQYRQAWEDILSRKDDDDVFEAEVVGVNRGGAICLVGGLRAFLPGSHLSGQLPTEDLVGQTIPLKFLEVNQEDNKLVVSNRRAVVEQQMSSLSRGDIVPGMVKALKPYGAFVEIGNMSGLLHISQISYDRIEDLERVLQPGQQLKCMIIDHDKLNGRIALSTKTLEPEPGDMLRDPQKVFELAEETAKKYHERMEVERKAREEAAKDIVLGLGDSLNDLTDDDDLSDALDDLTEAVGGDDDDGDDLDSIIAA